MEKRLPGIVPFIVAGLVVAATTGTGLAVDDFVKTWGEPADTLIKEGLELFYICHEDRANLERSNGKFREVLELDPDNEDAFWLIARNYFKMGDNAGDKGEKLRLYTLTGEYADQCLAVNPESIGGHFWKMATIGRTSEVKGILNSAMNLVPFKREIAFLIENADPAHEFHVLALSSRAGLLMKAPSFAGGDLEESERLLRRCVETNPRVTLFYVNLGQNLIKQKRYDEARELLLKVKNFEGEPFYIWDAVLYDIPRADRYLREIEGK
ncbi:tetratricopeptide repeat protein [Thermodesulfobacteriota bacterium]